MVPFEACEAAIEALGRVFWYKKQLRQFLISAGVPAAVVDAHLTSEVPKFTGVRNLFERLERDGVRGEELQLRILTELNKLRQPPGADLPDRDVAVDSLRHYKATVRDLGLVPKGDARPESTPTPRVQGPEVAKKRSPLLRDLHSRFVDLLGASTDPQARGYALEGILKELFKAYEIDYRGPYKIEGEQIDGGFSHDGFDYLVEARWRAKSPTSGQLGEFKTKVDGKLTSTRGLFISMAGFTPSSVVAFQKNKESSLILMDGEDLSLILAEQLTLPDALNAKIRKAAQEGVIFYPLRTHLT